MSKELIGSHSVHETLVRQTQMQEHKRVQSEFNDCCVFNSTLLAQPTFRRNKMNETKPDAPARGFAEIRRERVFEAINGERRYQEMKWGDLVDNPQSVGAYLTLMRVHLTRAENDWADSDGNIEALHCLRKVLAIGVACGEQHGMPCRPDTAPTPHANPFSDDEHD